jgi:intracellular sulfur oxidation DsrE/DsrF family protein
MKWVAIILVVVGVLAGIVAIEYFTVSIHALPAFLGGKPHHHVRGHYHKRGAIAALIAVVALGSGIYLFLKDRKNTKSTEGAAGPTPAPESGAGLL